MKNTEMDVRKRLSVFGAKQGFWWGK